MCHLNKETGITYPDITVITKLCKELNISEHEFFTACDDEASHQEKMEVKKYRTIKKWLFYIINIGYLIGLITCLICNLVIDHTLSWFLIVFVSILISFTLTSVPFYLKKNKYRWFKIAIIFTVLVYLLLFTIDRVYHGEWLLESFQIATFVFVFLWMDLLLCTFTHMDIHYKIAISLLLVAFITIYTNPFCDYILDFEQKENNIPNCICAGFMVIGAIGIVIKKIGNRLL